MAIETKAAVPVALAMSLSGSGREERGGGQGASGRQQQSNRCIQRHFNSREGCTAAQVALAMRRRPATCPGHTPIPPPFQYPL